MRSVASLGLRGGSRGTTSAACALLPTVAVARSGGSHWQQAQHARLPAASPFLRRSFASQPSQPDQGHDAGQPASSGTAQSTAPEQDAQKPESSPEYHHPKSARPGLAAYQERPILPFGRLGTWLRSKASLMYLEDFYKFKRSEFLEGAAMAFRTVMEQFPPDNLERFKDAFDDRLYSTIEDSFKKTDIPLHAISQLQELISASIKEVFIPSPPGQLIQGLNEIVKSGEPPKPIPVYITVAFRSTEKLISKLEIADKAPQVLSENMIMGNHEWVFEGILDPNHSPEWILISV